MGFNTSFFFKGYNLTPVFISLSEEPREACTLTPPDPHSHGKVVNEGSFGHLHIKHDGLGPPGIVDHLGLDHGVGQPGCDGGLHLVAVQTHLVIILHLHLTKSLCKFRARLEKMP